MDNQALKPDAPIITEAPETEALAITAAEQDDQKIAALHLSEGWQAITAEMKQDIADLTAMKGVDLKGNSLEEVGQKFIIASTVTTYLQKYIDKVENAAKAVAEHAGRK